MGQTFCEPLTIRSFSFNDDEFLLQAYRRLKYRVFVEELGWNSLVDEPDIGIAKVDPFDIDGLFLLAISKNDIPVGVIRGIALKDGFPHRGLFAHHLCHSQFTVTLDRLCMLNALAVLPEYRKKTFRVVGQRWEGTVAKLLVLGIMRLFEKQGLKAAIATAQGPVVYFFRKLGFLVIDRPSVTHLHADVLTNVGLVFGTAAHQQALAACKITSSEPQGLDEQALNLWNYFEECQQAALGPDHLENLVKQQ